MKNRLRFAAFAAAAAVPLSLVPAGLANAYDSGPYPGYGVYEDLGSQGCTPGYWKNHLQAWEGAGLSPDQSLSTVFATSMDATLHQALSFKGGPGTDGAARILLRAATAAVLNAKHEDVAYKYYSVAKAPAQGIIARVDAALASGDRGAMLALASDLDAANNGGCAL